MVKVSVLVAVYNAAAYLRQCLDSLLGQELADIQIVCVDDCSTDGSWAILEEYARTDSRVTTVRLMRNQGQAHARNEGLKVAVGEYICMLDADDRLSADALSETVKVFEKHPSADCVLFDVVMAWPDRSERYEMPDFVKISGEEAFKLSLTWKVHGLYMIKRGIHVKYPYDETCRLYSDDNTTRIHYLVAREVRRSSGRYYYRQHGMSATHKISVRRFDYLRANESMKSQMEALGVDADVLALYENVRWMNLIDVYMFYYCHAGQLAEKDREYGIAELKRVWNNIDKTKLSGKVRWRFGTSPAPCWTLFRIEETVYFFLRGLLGKNR